MFGPELIFTQAGDGKNLEYENPATGESGTIEKKPGGFEVTSYSPAENAAPAYDPSIKMISKGGSNNHEEEPYVAPVMNWEGDEQPADPEDDPGQQGEAPYVPPTWY